MIASRAQRPVEAFRIHNTVVIVTVFLALLLQWSLPLKLPVARLLDFPLLATIYFALLRRNQVIGIGLGTAVGLLQDALGGGFKGLFGMAKAVVGYLAASAGVKFNADEPLARGVLTGLLILVHDASIVALRHGLLESPPPFRPLDIAASILFNTALALVLFLILDRFRRPA